MSSNQARAESEEAESTAQASVQRAASSSSRRPVSEGREHTIRVLDELSCSPAECLKCIVSLLKDTTYQWWNTLISVVPRKNVTWELFQIEFRKKYISQRFLDQKKKEFLELKQGNMTVSEYERKFILLSKYSREWVPTEADICKRFEEGLNEVIKLLIRILELREFVVLAD
ncbi:Hexaprenyldihydroxybenzoate methyltransferase, mitochondrial-like protein [Gossypium australe]|uniref:Hexaprenyldihydroxybenzoate methyltransferase, mitochondrial-like protein n=1 Tax=Gossypium australe TaxID=47621 RepID=A0A5B6V9D2_9ROSI|nr:Hexaprenyldihydroxybenzoate methyltransferase, mitochondrial-like protein [Gossypium australe]